MDIRTFGVEELASAQMQDVQGGEVLLFLAGVAVGAAIGTMVGFAFTHAIMN